MSEDVLKWLEELGLEQYSVALAENDVEWRALPHLREEDLKELGVSLGHRRIMLAAIAQFGVEPEPMPNQGNPPKADPKARTPRSKSTQSQTLAERRQLTVMFCDLVDATQLSNSLDPEDLRTVISQYHEAVANVSEQSGGYVAQFLGDGVLLYFGYPIAHEDDAERALRAGLDVIDAVGSLRPLDKIQLSCRIGVATGQVVLAEVGANTTAAEPGATGLTPNLAARLQSVAEPDGMAVADSTRKLVGEQFEVRSIGTVELKGLDPTVAWAVTGKAQHGLRYASQRPGEVKFVGRAGELAALNERWDMAGSGHCQTILVSGEAGIGKSRLCREFMNTVGNDRESTLRMEWQCSSFYSASALYPVKQYLFRACGIRAGETALVRRAKLRKWLERVGPHSWQDEQLALIAVLLDAGEKSEDRQVIRDTIDLLVELLAHSLGNQTLLLFVEDVHWIDSSTEELLEQVSARFSNSPAMILFTCRQGYASGWRTQAPPELISLGNLPTGKARELAETVMNGYEIAADQIGEIVARTDGLPLYIEEVARTVREAKQNTDVTNVEIPATLQDSLMAQLDRLGSTKIVAQAASVIGRRFSPDVVARMIGDQSINLSKAFSGLLDAGLLTQHGSETDRSYSFRHALIRDAAYASMVRDQKRKYHAAIAEVLICQGDENEMVADELVAYHSQNAENFSSAVKHWVRAGKREANRGADREASAHYRSALKALEQVGQSCNNDDLRLELQVALGECLLNAEGYGSKVTQRFWDDMLEQAVTDNDPTNRFRFFVGLSPTLYARGRLKQDLDLFDSLDKNFIEQSPDDVKAAFYGHRAVPLFLMAEPKKAWEELESRIDLFERVSIKHTMLIAGAKAFVAPLAYGVRILVVLGQFDRAKKMSDRLVELARLSDHPPSLCWALQTKALLKLYQEQPDGLRLALEEYEPIAKSIGLKTRMASATFLSGCLQILSDDVDAGARLAYRGLEEWREVGGVFHSSEYALIIANLLVNRGRVDLVPPLLEYVRQVQEISDERIGSSELYRLRAHLLREAGEGGGGALIEQALAHAAQSGELLFSIRAACDLTEFAETTDDRSSALRKLRELLSRAEGGGDFVEIVRASSLIAQTDSS